MPHASMRSVGSRLRAGAQGGKKIDFGVPGAPLTEHIRAANEQHLAFSTPPPTTASGDSICEAMVVNEAALDRPRPADQGKGTERLMPIIIPDPACWGAIRKGDSLVVFVFA